MSHKGLLEEVKFKSYRGQMSKKGYSAKKETGEYIQIGPSSSLRHHLNPLEHSPSRALEKPLGKKSAKQIFEINGTSIVFPKTK